MLIGLVIAGLLASTFFLYFSYSISFIKLFEGSDICSVKKYDMLGHFINFLYLEWDKDQQQKVFHKIKEVLQFFFLNCDFSQVC